jgi:Fe-S-cluster containining protein
VLAKPTKHKRESARKITCDDCGKCCSGQAYLPLAGNLLDNDQRRDLGWEIVVLPIALQEELERGLAANPRFEGTCVWFDPETKGCRHYELRPSTCREFEMGGEDCVRIQRSPGSA